MLVESEFGVIWEDPQGGFTKFVVKRASKQDQTLHMEGETSRYSILQGGVPGLGMIISQILPAYGWHWP